MTSKLLRIFAMACSAATLVCVAIWLFAGAPNAPHINILIDPAMDAYFKNGDVSISWQAVWGLAQVSPLAAHLLLCIISLSVGTAAVLSLILLLKSGKEDATRYLGIGLGWWSFSICYLGLIITLPTFALYSHLPFLVRLAFDTAAFLLLLAAAYAVLAFWQRFPRPVSEDELDAFLKASRGSKAMPVPARRSTAARVVRKLLAVYLIGTMGLLWRGNIYLPDYLPEPADTLLSLAILFSNLGCIYVLGLPVFKCLRLLKFHRALGSPEDRAKIEWIWTAIWIAVILCLLPAVLAPAMYLAEYWFPELAFDYGWLGLYLLLAYNSAPLIVMVALALSVFSRGAIDPRLALRGFTIWTLLGIVLTLIFVFIERLVATRVVLWMHLPPQTGYVTAGAIVAATFQPIRKRMEKWVNRFVERVLPETLLASGRRGLAAVSVVDLSGYTALTAKDEPSALLASALLQKEAHLIADARGGRVVKSTGDGVIMAFRDARECLTGVEELHRAVAVRAAALGLPALTLHSGLHWGEVVEMHDGDIYGMTVNVAARIADWAKAGEIGLSEGFQQQLSGSASGLVAAGPQRFKNVPEPIVCYRLAT